MNHIDNLKPWPRKRTDEERACHDAELLASGEPLALKNELFKLIPGLTRPLLHRYIGAWDPVHKSPCPPPIRYVAGETPKRYCIRDVREAFDRDAPRREAAKAQRILEGQKRAEREHAAAVARKAAKEAKAAETPAPASTPKKKPPIPAPKHRASTGPGQQRPPSRPVLSAPVR